jgi:transcriptional regulator with XRE-family HTH domain
MRKMRRVRLLKEITLDELYLRTGRKISQPRLSRFERGIALPSEEEKALIARALKEPVERLFPED